MFKSTLGFGVLSLLVVTLQASATEKVKQVITINNGSEVTSLDPHKVEGVPEGNVILNLLEGLVYTDIDGKAVSGVAKSWSNENFTTWILLCGKMQSGVMAHL